jgi:hypothetical protein
MKEEEGRGRDEGGLDACRVPPIPWIWAICKVEYSHWMDNGEEMGNWEEGRGGGGRQRKQEGRRRNSTKSAPKIRHSKVKEPQGKKLGKGKVGRRKEEGRKEVNEESWK